jgi:single-strand DNA-binding protein
MASLNKVMLIGRLGKDPETKYTAGGDMVANFSIATDEKWTKDGESHEKTEWHRIVAWRKLAEIVQKYTRKGSQIYIEGKIRTREWEDREGNKRYTTEINADRIVLLVSKNNGETQESQQTPESHYVTVGLLPLTL